MDNTLCHWDKMGISSLRLDYLLERGDREMYNISSFLQETLGNDALKSGIVLEF